VSCRITNVKTVSGLGLTPARVHRPTGTVFLNSEIWDKLPPEDQDFILGHEEGHFCEQTISEIKADGYAFNKLAGKKENSLRNIVSTISHNLEITKIPEHKKRYELIVYRAFLKDWLEFNNKKAYQILKEMEAEQIKNLFIDYLKNKGIANVNILSDEEKEMYLTDFMLTPEMQQIVVSEAKAQLGEDEYSNFALFSAIKGLFNKDGKENGEKKPLFSPETKDKFKGIFNNIAGGLISKLGNGLGFNPNVSAISSAVNPVNNIGTGKTNDHGGGSSGGGTSKTNTSSTEDTPEDAEKEKKKKIMLFGGIGLLLIGIGIALYFGLRNN